MKCGVNVQLRNCLGDGLLRYGWVAHDGINFGIQDIIERGYFLRTEFVKRSGGDHGGDWTWRISGVQVMTTTWACWIQQDLKQGSMDADCFVALLFRDWSDQFEKKGN